MWNALSGYGVCRVAKRTYVLSASRISRRSFGYHIRDAGRDVYMFEDGYELRGIGDQMYVLRGQGPNAISQRQRLNEYLLAALLQSVFVEYRIDIVLDVGANTGQFASQIRRGGYAGRIVSFEPTSGAFAGLSRAAASDPLWEVQNVALGEEEGTRDIYVADASVFSSFLRSSEWSRQHFGEASVGRRQETVTVRRLDHVLGERLGRPDTSRLFLKMDTQGADLEVFAGLGPWRTSVFALQTEVCAIPIYEGMRHFTESITTLEEAGFRIAGMFPVNTDRRTLQVIEFDCVMVRHEDLP